MNNIHILRKVVTANDLDELNHVNNVVYVKWMEEIALDHWLLLTKENLLAEYVWVVVRHEIEYIRQAVLDDELTIKTWVGNSKSFKSERHIEFYLKEKLLVKALTIWGLLDSKTYKPVRITENILNILQP